MPQSRESLVHINADREIFVGSYDANLANTHLFVLDPSSKRYL